MRKFRKSTSMRAEIEWNEKLLIDLEWPNQQNGLSLFLSKSYTSLDGVMWSLVSLTNTIIGSPAEMLSSRLPKAETNQNSSIIIS